MQEEVWTHDGVPVIQPAQEMFVFGGQSVTPAAVGGVMFGPTRAHIIAGRCQMALQLQWHLQSGAYSSKAVCLLQISQELNQRSNFQQHASLVSVSGGEHA